MCIYLHGDPLLRACFLAWELVLPMFIFLFLGGGGFRGHVFTNVWAGMYMVFLLCIVLRPSCEVHLEECPSPCSFQII